MDVEFCIEALEEALCQGRPEIFNTDQGAQFTSQEFTGRLLKESIQISMDGKGRAIDNVMIERLWRSVKYEEIYLKSYTSRPIAVRELSRVSTTTATNAPTRAWATGPPGKPSKPLSENDPADHLSNAAPWSKTRGPLQSAAGVHSAST